MRLHIALIALIVLSAPKLRAQGAFDAVRCGDDVPRALKGKRIPNGPVAQTQAAYAALSLRHNGSIELRVGYWYEGWTLCGQEYAFLVGPRDVVLDVVPFPSHDTSHPGFIGQCSRNGHVLQPTVLAVLQRPSASPPGGHFAPNDTTLEHAAVAWRFDEAQGRIVPMRAEGLMCSRDGIFTEDGGA